MYIIFFKFLFFTGNKLGTRHPNVSKIICYLIFIFNCVKNPLLKSLKIMTRVDEGTCGNSISTSKFVARMNKCIFDKQ